MANQFLNAQEYSNVMLLLLKNQLVTGRLVTTKFKDEVTDENGLTTNIKRPPRFIDKKSGLSAALALQDNIVGSVDVAVTEYSKVHVSIGDIEQVQSYNELMQNETMKSAASTLAHSVDSFLQNKLLRFHSWVGTPGTNITTVDMANAGHTRLMEQGVPNTDLAGTMQFVEGQKIRASLSGVDNADINRPAIERTRIPVLSEVNWFATQQGPSITTGTRAASGATLIAGANQNVNYRDVKVTNQQTLNVDGLSASQTVTAGEVFTIAGVFAWDWRNQQALPHLQDFTVLANATADGGGAATLTISPAIIVQGTTDGTSTDANSAFGTVSAAPADNAAVTYRGAPSTIFKISAAWQKSALALVSAKLHMPFSDTASFSNDPETGISLRYWRGSDISTGAHVHRWDMIYGATVLDPDRGVRVSGV